LERHPRASLRVYAIWAAKYGFDSRDQRDGGGLTNRRVVHLWDGPDIAGDCFVADNFFGIPAGTYAPAVADGVYLLLAPLTPGPHTISFGGTAFSFGSSFSQDITYHLTVSS
jgi:hypothetical protein